MMMTLRLSADLPFDAAESDDAILITPDVRVHLFYVA